MSQKSAGLLMRVPAEKRVRDIRRAACERHYGGDKIHSVLEEIG